jgi:hypothetical protein
MRLDSLQKFLVGGRVAAASPPSSDERVPG